MRRLPPFALLALLACAHSTGEQPSPSSTATRRADLAADRAELLRLHEGARRAHLERRADWMVREWSDSLVSVNHGRVSVTRPADGQPRFQEYFDAVDFQAWDDIVPPRIRISPDGQMAYAIVEKRVHLTPRDSSGATPERTRFAWMSVYEKQGGRWRLAAIASTDRPDSL
ncbi:MAG TPA: nuclear transport factor 2 family protein [Gemmatimonadales bacterium]|nr:nuclear transport factor 2 family protein [Gemmatimonadales bacterium]